MNNKTSTSGPGSAAHRTARERRDRTIAVPCGSTALALGRVPCVMGILNVTPDSFSDGGRFDNTDAAISQAILMYRAGAGIIDIGGESTRPDADPVSADEELGRVLPVIDALAGLRKRGELPIPLSIDTRKAEVAEAAIERGCLMINDVTAASDPGMVNLLRRHDDIPIVIMHMKGIPKTMQDKPWYQDVTVEVSDYLAGRAQDLEKAGIGRNRIIIDPGIGFGKRFSDNLKLLNRVDSLRRLGYPVLIGASRKRFLGELLDAEENNRLPGNLAVAARCYEQCVEIVRVHDVAETAGLFRVLDAMAYPENYEASW